MDTNKEIDKTTKATMLSDSLKQDINKLFERMTQDHGAMQDDFSKENVDKLFTPPQTGAKKYAQGLEAVLNSKNFHQVRLPILDIVFDRLVRLLTTTLRKFTSDNVDVSYSRIASVPFFEYLNSIPLPTLIGVCKANQWDAPCLINVDNQLIYAIVDVLLGGKRSTQTSLRQDGRAYTTLEKNLVQRFIEVILSDFTEAFAPVSKVDFQHERLETNPRFAAIVNEKNIVMKITFKIAMEDRGGHFSIIIPYSSIEPIRDVLLQNFTGEKFGQDQVWKDNLAARVREADVNLEATLPLEKLPLKEVLSWKKGSCVLLSSTAQSPIYLCIKNYQLFAGKIGQQNGHMAVKINDVLFGEGDLQ